MGREQERVVYNLVESSVLGHSFYFPNCVLSWIVESTLCNTEYIGELGSFFKARKFTVVAINCWHNPSLLTVRSPSVDCIKVKH